MQFQSPVIPFPGAVQQRRVWWRRWRGPRAARHTAAATAPAGPHQGQGSFTPSNPSLAGVRGCVGEHGGGVSCVRSRFICVVVCLCVCAVCLSGDLRPVICCSNNLALLHSGCWWPGAAPRQERSGSVPRHGRAAAPCGRQQQSSSSRAEWSHHLFTERAITHTANPEHNTFQIPNFTYYINLVRMTIGKSKRFRLQLRFNAGSK